jgi:predicted RNA binding protein YcfA (HicA-like mRNA interferase family)
MPSVEENYVMIFLAQTANKLIKHLESYGCILIREGRKHSLYKNIEKNKFFTIPRHPLINKIGNHLFVQKLNYYI